MALASSEDDCIDATMNRTIVMVGTGVLFLAVPCMLIPPKCRVLVKKLCPVYWSDLVGMVRSSSILSPEINLTWRAAS